MGYLCDFCGEQRSMVYCRSDAANLCLSCDRNVHSANALSKRHSRTLSCEKCNSQPASVRCIEERISLCQNCDWLVHVANTNTSHKRQPVNCYSGCPSAAELSAMWSFILDFSSVGNNTCEEGMGSMSITDNSNNRHGDCQSEQGKNNLQNESAVEENSYVLNEQMDGSRSSAMPKGFLPGAKGPAICEDDSFYDDLNMDEVDLSMEHYEELFGVSLNDDQEQLFDSDGMDELFGTKEISDSNCHGGYAAEGSSIGGMKAMQPANSTAASGDSVASCKTEPNLYFTRLENSGISFSGINEECNVEDYQDCAASPMLVMGEPPWYPPGVENPIPSSSRNDAVMRYMEKKKTRKFDKKVRYESRKARADVRRRVKGRFVKAGDAYDYDPLSQTRSY